jgi:hypothetical protein
MISVTVENDCLVITVDNETTEIPLWLVRLARVEEWQEEDHSSSSP